MPAHAGLIHRSNSTAKNPLAKAVLNLGSDRSTQTFINAFKACALNANPTTDYLKLDLTGYPVSAPSANMAFSCSGILFPNTSYRFRMSATRKTFIGVNSTGWGACSTIGGSPTVTNCTGSSGQFTIQSSGTGTGPDDVVQVTTGSASSISMFFSSAGTYAPGSGDVAFYRTSDETAYLAGKYFTPEYISELQGAGPGACRMMGLTNTNFNGEVSWAYRIQPNNFGWVTTQFPPTIVNPDTTANLQGTDTYTGLAATDTPGSITAYEMYIARIQNANTGAAATLNIGGRGAKTILDNQGLAPAANKLAAGSIYTFWYDPVLDAYITNENQFGTSGGGGGGIASGMPIEAQVQLANTIPCDLWSNLPTWATDDYATNWGAYVGGNLQSNLNFYPEPGNETWNSQFFANSFMNVRGQALGFTTSGTTLRPPYDYHGLRFKQIVNDIAAVWPGGAASSRLRPAMGVITVPAFTGSTQSFRLEGSDLTTIVGNSSYCIFTGGTWNGSSCSGGANWNVAPNRPIDAAYAVSIAPYVGGTNLLCGPDISLACAVTANNGPFYQALINAWEGGNTATAIGLVDNDIRQGLTNVQTVTASGTTFTTPLSHGFTAASTNIAFTVSGGTSYSGVPTYSPTNQSAVYQVDTTPTATTFTMKTYAGGVVTGADINAGSAGSGTLSVGRMSGNSMLSSVTLALPYTEALAERYNGGAGGSRPVGMGPLMSLAYEANLEPQGPQTFAQCTTLGVTYPSPTTINITANEHTTMVLDGIASTAGILAGMTVTGTNIPAGTIVTIVNAASLVISQAATNTASGVSIAATANCITDTAQSILAWKNDPLAAQTEWDYMKQFMGTYQGAANFGLMTYSQGGAQLVNMGGGVYGFLPNSSLTSPIVPFQMYNGFHSFNTNWLLKRDLDPASNDNDPIWLEKAA